MAPQLPDPVSVPALRRPGPQEKKTSERLRFLQQYFRLCK